MSAGFLLACIAVTNDLQAPAPNAEAVLVPALGALAIGVAGMSFCIAVQLRAQRVMTARLAAVDCLVERLEALNAEDFQCEGT